MGILNAPPAQFDPKGSLFASLIRKLIDDKGIHAPRRNWRPIHLKHLPPASIYESRAEWRSPPKADRAIGQLHPAIRAENKSRQNPSPTLRYRLAKAYRKDDKPKEVVRCYLEATKGFIVQSDGQEARTAPDRTAALRNVAAPSQKQALDELRA